MLKSLFGELTPLRDGSHRRGVEKNEFASTAVMETMIDENAEHQSTTDRHLRELFVTGSAAHAMRTHFAAHRDEHAPGPEQHIITLFDPAQMWAGAVIKALSDASGQPIEKLQLRDQASMNSLALIERTTLPRRQDETLKVYYADVQNQACDAGQIPHVLMERSDLAAVVVGPLQPSAVDEMLATLLRSVSGESWRCRDLLFLLPVGAAWISQKIEALRWPASLHVEVIAEPLTSASTVWNKLLAHWNQIKPHPAEQDNGGAATAALAPGAAHAVAAPGASHATARPTTAPAPVVTPPSPTTPQAAPGLEPGSPVLDGARRPPDPERAAVILHELTLLDGLIFAALVDCNTGLVVASEGRGPDIDRAAAAATEIMRVHRRTLRQMGHWRPTDPVDEILVTAGSRYHILRTLQAHPDFFILTVLDKLRSNLAMTRFRIMEAQQVLT